MKSRLIYLVTAFVLVASLFTGCDDKSKDTSANAKATEGADKIKVKEPEQSLEQRYKDRNFLITDISEANVGGANAISITFSTPLKENQKFNSLVSIYDKTNNKNVDGSWELSKAKNELILKYVDPATEYVISINKLSSGGIVNIIGKELENDLPANNQFSVRTSEAASVVGFTSTASLLPHDIAEGLPITAINVDSVNINFYRIDDKHIKKFIDVLYNRSSTSAWNLEDLIKKEENSLVYSARYDLNLAKNARETVIIPTKDIKELQKSGVYIAIMTNANKYYHYMIPSTLFTITDIGVSLHKNANAYEIFTQNIKDGKSLPDVEIKLLDKMGKISYSGKTDKKGYVKIPNDINNAILIATKKGQTSFIPLNKPALDLSEFSISGAPGFKKTFFAFGPRDIYRPGENVLVNALLRDHDGKMIQEQPIKVEILQADNKVLKSFTWQGKKGFYTYEFNLPTNAPTGGWKLKFDLGDENSRFYNFKVEDFMPEKIALEVNVSDTPLNINSNAVFNVYGKYLYGAPASKNRLTGKLSLRPLRNAVKELPGFHFGSITEEELTRSISTIDNLLNDEGKLEVTVENSWKNLHSPVSIMFEASLLESGGRAVTRTVKQAIWPSEKLPAVRPTFDKKRAYNYDTNRYEQQYSVDSDSFAQFEIVFADFKGEKYKKDNLQVTLIRERRNYYWQQGSDGWYTGYTQKNIPIESFSVSTQDGESTKVGFDVDWGPYIIEVLDKTTGTSSSLRFYAGYNWQDSTSSVGSRPEQIKLKIDKPNYKAGEVARVSINPPDAGSGYLMVESSEGVLWWQEISIPKEGKTFELPVSKEWDKHDIYISAMVVRGADKNAGASVKRAVGLLHLPLYRDDRKIDFKILTPQKIDPNTDVSIKLKADISANKNRNIKAIVSAVDSGILSITDFETPDPFEAFFGKQRFNVDIYDVYGNIIEGAGKKATFKFGGDLEDEEALSRAGKKPVTKIQIVALQSDVITFDENGEAEVIFAIPDFNGELRFMAQVWSDEEYASNEDRSIVAADVIVELAHPRFLAGSDKARLVLDLNNLSDKKQDLKVDIQTDGLLSLDSDISQTVTLSSKQKSTVTIPLTTLNGFGEGNVIVRVSNIKDNNGEDKLIDKKWTIGVRPPYPAQTFSLMKSLSNGDRIDKSDFEKGYLYLDPSTTNAQVSLTSVPPLNLSFVIKELFAYPYGCLEQTISGLYPSVFTNSEQLHRLHIKSSSDEERRKNIEKGITRILGMQKQNGSFGLWSSDSYEAHWLSVYATDFLINAKQNGYEVPGVSLNKAIERLQYYLNNSNLNYEYTDDRSVTQFSVKAYAALVLAKVQKAPLGNLRNLYDGALQSKLPLATMQLGIALRLMGDNERADALLQRSLHLDLETRGSKWYGDYGSPTRDRAQMLALMYEFDLYKSQRGEFLLDLSKAIRKKGYLSTQEKNSLFLAGINVLGSSEPNWDALFVLDGKEERIFNNKESFNKVYDFKGITSLNSITNTNKDDLYATINIIGYPLNAPKPYSNGVSIEREYYSIEGKPMELKELKSGDLLVVVLNIKSLYTRMPDALVVDLLPAGLELENQNLGHSSINIENSEIFSKNSELAAKVRETTIYHQEFRDDRYVAAIDLNQYRVGTLVYLARAVTPGSYKVPPPYVEAMYSPEIYAIGKTPSILHVK